jgi:hypothetical protein
VEGARATSETPTISECNHMSMYVQSLDLALGGAAESVAGVEAADTRQWLEHVNFVTIAIALLNRNRSLHHACCLGITRGHTLLLLMWLRLRLWRSPRLVLLFK